MKKGIIIGLSLSLTIMAWAADVNLDGTGNKAWSGSSNLKPSDNYTPQQLVVMGNAAPAWVYSEDVCDDADNEWWRTVYDNEDYNYNYMLFQWENNDYVKAYSRWRIRVDSLAIINLFYWDGSGWDHIQNNGGGWYPVPTAIEVTNYFGEEYLLLLAQGYTPDSGDNTMDCDLSDLFTKP